MWNNVSSKFLDFKPVGYDDRIFNYLDSRPYYSPTYWKLDGRQRYHTNVLTREIYEELTTFRYIGLNPSGYVRWMVAECATDWLESRLNGLVRSKAPLPYRVTVVDCEIAYLYWCLSTPVRLTYSGMSKGEVHYKKIFSAFCKVFKFKLTHSHFLTVNPLYIGFKTARVDNNEHSLSAFYTGVGNALDKDFFFDARDYLFNVVSHQLREKFREEKPGRERYSEYWDFAISLMEEVDLSDYPDANTVAFDDLADYMVNWLFKYYDRHLEDFRILQSKRGERHGAYLRDIWLDEVLELRLSGHGYRKICRITGQKRTTVRRWIDKYYRGYVASLELDNRNLTK